MVLIKIGYEPKNKYKWKELSKDYPKEFYNGKFVITIHEILFQKIKNIIAIRNRGYDSIILVDGARRSGKSTVAKTIAYILNPNMTIKNFVAGIEESAEKIENSATDDVLIFDEGSLVANSKEGLKRKNVQLEKIIDVIGQKRLTLIFCMPSFFTISRAVAVTHSRFLIHVYTNKMLDRGNFLYFGTMKKRVLYDIGKKNNHSYKKPKRNFNGHFVDFQLPFEDEYNKLKMESLKETLNPDRKKDKPLNESTLKTKFMVKFKENCPDITDVIIQKGFGMKKSEYYRRRQGYLLLHSPQSLAYTI